MVFCRDADFVVDVYFPLIHGRRRARIAASVPRLLVIPSDNPAWLLATSDSLAHSFMSRIKLFTSKFSHRLLKYMI